MPHIVSSSRDSRLASVLSNNDIKDNGTKLNQLAELLSLDTSLDSEQFLFQFMSLKQRNLLVNDLCQRSCGFMGLSALAYACKSDKKRTERYRNIVLRLKKGLDIRNKSYVASNNTSVYKKVEILCNHYLTKSYDSKDSEKYKQDRRVCQELKKFQ